jgi:hypothetical protein
MPEIRMIILDPPQPCGIVDVATGQPCGAPARYATAEAAREHGYLLVLPVCEGCARSQPGRGTTCRAPTHDDADLVLVTHSIKLPTVPAPGILRTAADLLDDEATRMQRDAGVLRERANELAARN